MIRTVIFDVDGVLVYSGVFGRRIQAQLELPRAVLEAFWHGAFARCSLGLADLKEEMRPLLAQWGYGGSVEECLREWFEADSTINAEMLAVVARLTHEGIPCHLASTQERYRAEYLEGAMGFSQLFQRRFFSCRIGVRKPDPKFYQHITQELAVPPESLLFIDDQDANVEAARRAGWQAEKYTRGDDVGALLARHGVPVAL